MLFFFFPPVAVGALCLATQLSCSKEQRHLLEAWQSPCTSCAVLQGRVVILQSKAVSLGNSCTCRSVGCHEALWVSFIPVTACSLLHVRVKPHHWM